MSAAAGQAKWMKERLDDVGLGVLRNERDESRGSRTVNWRVSELGDGSQRCQRDQASFLLSPRTSSRRDRERSTTRQNFVALAEEGFWTTL